MTTQEQAYINGFVKRANQYGLTNREAIELLKQAAPGMPPINPAAKSVKVKMPPVTPAMKNDTVVQKGQRSANQDPRTGRLMTPEQLDAANY